MTKYQVFVLYSYTSARECTVYTNEKAPLNEQKHYGSIEMIGVSRIKHYLISPIYSVILNRSLLSYFDTR